VATLNSNFPSLSLCMIVKDEAHFLGRCLDAVKDYVDQIVVVDTGSTDATCAIARERGAEIHHFEWVEDFAAARNDSISYANGDWILVLDADEWMEPQHMQQIRQEILDTEVDAFVLMQRNYSDNPLEHNWIPVKQQTAYTGGFEGYRSHPIARLFRNGIGLHFEGTVHEMVAHPDRELKTRELDIPMHHSIDGHPTKPMAIRQRAYLRLMARSLAKKPEGRLATYAGSVCMHFEADYSRAIEFFQMAIEVGHRVEENTESLAEANYRLGDTERAYSLYMQLYREDYLTFSLCNNLANLSVKKGEHGFAAALLRKALKRDVLDGENAERLRHNIAYLEAKAAESPRES